LALKNLCELLSALRWFLSFIFCFAGTARHFS